MIKGFSEQTHELTDDEKNIIVPKMVRGLQTKIGKANTITNSKMIDGLIKSGHSVTAPRIRKMIRYIRMTGLVPRLVATSKGYYVSNDDKELTEYIDSLLQRADSINQLAEQLEFQRKQLKS